jgi:H/ACA ribonucleoprotein complex subunit 2
MRIAWYLTVAAAAAAASRAAQELGASGLSKRPTSCMLILPKPVKGGKDDDEQKEFDEAYSEVEKKINAMV